MLNININAQPDDETCGPTSLHALYQYYGDDISLKQIINEVERTSNGGTLASLLGKHALKRGHETTIYVYNLDIFDPTWFDCEGNATINIAQKLEHQLKYKKSKRMQEAAHAHIDYLNCGGKIKFIDLTITLLKRHFMQEVPIIAGLSATYLYHSARERYVGNQCIYDDLRGEPTGHFVVLCGYDLPKRRIVVADPHRANPISNDNYYKVSISRLINAIMLGVFTYDANMLMIKPICKHYS